MKNWKVTFVPKNQKQFGNDIQQALKNLQSSGHIIFSIFESEDQLAGHPGVFIISFT